LFTSIHPFYERLGWQTIRQMEQEMDLHQIPVTAAPVAVRPLQPADFSVLQAIFGALQDRVQGMMLRSEQYWQVRGEWMNHTPVIVQENHQVLAYFFAAKYRLSEPILTISEYGVAQD